jgi:ATP-dependent DNA helicase RecQ
MLLYDLRDRRIQQFFLTRRYPDAEQLGEIQDALVKLAADASVAFGVLRAALPRISQAKIKVGVKLLVDAGAARRCSAGHLGVGNGQLGPQELHALAVTYVDKAEADREKLERMVFYAQTGLCRWRVLLDYFGESLPADRCGRCDNCQRMMRREQTLEPVPNPLRVPATKPRRREYVSGDLVSVPRYGAGRVRDAVADEVTIEFPNGEVRTFVRSYVCKSTHDPAQST